MQKLHIANTFFEEELSSSIPFALYKSMHRHPIFLQLQFLPYLYAQMGDGIALSDLPDPGYVSVLERWNLPRLAQYRLDDKAIPRYERLESWGASLAVARWAEAHHQSYSMPAWDIVKEVNSKAFSYQHAPRLPHATLLHNKEEAEKWLKSLNKNHVLKTLFGLSGKGHLLIDASTPLKRIFAFLTREWEQQRPVIAEPWVERALDFSTQWIIGNLGSIEYVGSTVCINNSRGEYVASKVGEEKLLFGPWLPFLEEHNATALLLLQQLLAKGYQGNVGFDAMVYRTPQLRLHPIVEINARKTMGLAAVLFQQKHFPNQILTFRFAKGNEGLLPSAIQLSNGRQIAFKRNLQINIEN